MEEGNRRDHRKTIRRMIWIIIGIAVLCLAAWLLLFRINRFSLAIHINGEEEIILEYGERYSEPGAKLFLQGSLVFQDGISLPGRFLTEQGEVRDDTLGRYFRKYSASFAGLTAEAERKVCVVDTQCPVITLTEDPTAFWHPETGYREAGYTAVDNYDGDITDRVVCTAADGLITYAVIDSSGNPGYAERKVYDHDMIPPEIHLNGDAHYVLSAGHPYEEPGYIVTDNCDTDLTEKIQVEGEVNWLKPGLYTLTYSVRDSFQNYASATREVEVVGAAPPAVNWPTGKTVYLTFDDGPGPYTRQLLDILDRYDAKATFFVKDAEEYNDIMADIVSRGHAIGLHSATHVYEEVYSSTQAYFTDLWKIRDIVLEQTGQDTTLVRFPGGSSNTVSVYTRSGIMTILSHAVPDAGFQYFDWNVDSDDVKSAKTASAVARNVITGIGKNNTSLVLQHDTQAHSVEAVEEILAWGTENGYAFLPLSPDSPGFHHDLRN